MTATTTGIEVTVPDIGDFGAVPIIEVHVAPGDKVNAEDPLLTLESDKATMDVPAPRAGTVTEVLVKVGDEVSEGITDPVPRPRGRRRDHSAVAGGAAGARARPGRGEAGGRGGRGAAGGTARGVHTRRRPGAGRGARRPERAADGPRAGRRPVGGDRVRAEGPDHEGRPAGVPEGPGPARPRPPPRRRAGLGHPGDPGAGLLQVRPGRDAEAGRGSRRCRARSCTGRGSTSRTSRTTTRPTSPSSTPTASSSTPRRRARRTRTG